MQIGSNISTKRHGTLLNSVDLSKQNAQQQRAEVGAEGIDRMVWEIIRHAIYDGWPSKLRNIGLLSFLHLLGGENAAIHSFFYSE